MIIIDKEQEIQAYFEKIDSFEIPLVRLDSASFELAQGIQDELILIHIDQYQDFSISLKAKLNEQKGVILFFKDEDLILENLVYSFNKDSSLASVYSHLFHIQSLYRENIVLKSQLLSLNREMSGLIGSVETELLRVKKFYEHNAPKRYKDIKGLKLLSKYAAGESIGGEFFDIFEKQNKIFLLMSDTSSYLASSSILSLFTAFKMENEITLESNKRLVEDIKAEMQEISQNKKKELEVSVLSVSIDLNSYEVEGFIFGDFKGISSLKLDKFSGMKKNLIHAQVDEGKVADHLTRGERLIFLSPGLNRSWSQLKPDFMIEELLNKSNVKQIDILDEIFFQLKKNRKSGFLPHDASAIMMEVQKNVIIQV